MRTHTSKYANETLIKFIKNYLEPLKRVFWEDFIKRTTFVSYPIIIMRFFDKLIIYD